MTRLTILLIVVLMASVSLAVVSANPYGLELQAPIDKWDEAIPLGNGLMGGLLWGNGNTIRLSLDRGDLWDLRPHPSYVMPGFTYARVRELAQAGKAAQLNQEYARGNDFPTKLPGGRLVLTLKSGQTAQMFRLDMREAKGVVELGDTAVECFFSATKPVALLKVPGKCPEFKLVTNQAVQRLDAPPATEGRDRDSVWFSQETALGLRYVVYVQASTVPNGTLLAMTVTSSTDSKDPLSLARQQAGEALEVGYANLFADHRKWWSDFWTKSSVTIPHARIQHHYNLVQYFYGAASRPDAPPMALQGLWTADAGTLPPWHGDYHHDLNTQLTYWAHYTSGRFDQGLSFINFMWQLKPVHEQWTRNFWNTNGFVVPGVMAQDGKPMGSWFQYTLSPTMGAWVAQAFYWQWRYTMDAQFLRGRAYPYCQGIAEALVDLMSPDENGKLKLPLSSSPEIHNNTQAAWLTPNSNNDLALIRWILGANAEMAEVLGKQQAAERWNGLLARMDALAVEGQDGPLRVSPDESLAESHRHFAHLMAIHPLGILHVEGSQREVNIINASLAQMETLGTRAWCGYSFAWMACMQARCGKAEKALWYLDNYVNSFILRNGFHCNGEQTRKGLSNFHYRPFTLEGNFAAGQAVHEMLLQTWGGRVRVFPAVPQAWQDVSFERLRGEGGYVISAKRSQGRTVQVTITGTVDSVLRLKDPFDGAAFDANRRLEHKGDELQCHLKAGQSVTLNAVASDVTEPKAAEIPKAQSFADRLEYVGIAVQEEGWHIWGSSPVIGPDGKVHLFVARWPVTSRFDPGWRIASQIAHYVSETPEGPFAFADVALTGTGRETWDKTGVHNPAIHKVGDMYMLLYISNTGLKGHPANQCIGMSLSKSLDGPWQKVGRDGLILTPSPDPGHWTHKASNGVNNPAFLHVGHGRFFLYYKSEKSKMGLAISERLEGPYIHQPDPVTSNEVGIEDGYAFMRGGKVCLLTTDNHGILKRGGGLLWTSTDGYAFDPEPQPGFGVMRDYIPAEAFARAKNHYGRGGKFERPQVLLIHGRPDYVYMPAGTNIQGGSGTVSYVLRVKVNK